jgi:hypothetical protein
VSADDPERDFQAGDLLLLEHAGTDPGASELHVVRHVTPTGRVVLDADVAYRTARTGKWRLRGCNLPVTLRRATREDVERVWVAEDAALERAIRERFVRAAAKAHEDRLRALSTDELRLECKRLGLNDVIREVDLAHLGASAARRKDAFRVATAGVEVPGGEPEEVA